MLLFKELFKSKPEYRFDPYKSFFLGPLMLCEGQNGHQSGQKCLMCMNLHNDPVFLWRCGSNHRYCKSCSDFLDGAGICPKCRKEALRQGNQPAGNMTWVTEPNSSLPGYDSCGIIVTHFIFDQGIQGACRYVLFCFR